MPGDKLQRIEKDQKLGGGGRWRGEGGETAGSMDGLRKKRTRPRILCHNPFVDSTSFAFEPDRAGSGILCHSDDMTSYRQVGLCGCLVVSCCA